MGEGTAPCKKSWFAILTFALICVIMNMKRILIGLGIALGLLLIAAIAIPYLFRDRIVAAVKEVANDNLTATLDFKDVDISLFRNFPKLSVGLDDLTITGKGEFEGTTLLRAKRLDVGVDLSVVVGSALSIESVEVEDADINVYVLEDGRANYDIAKPTTEKAPEKQGKETPIRLERYALKNVAVRYDDRTMPVLAVIKGLNHTGKGEFTADVYDLATKTSIDSLSVNYDGTQYLSRAKATWDAVINANMPQTKFTLKENKMVVNDLQLNLDGWLQMPNDKDMVMDFTFGTPQNTFKSFLSIIPGAYTKDFAQVKADGSLELGGFVRGTYNEKTYPAFKLDAKVGNGSVKYPSLPLGLSNINVVAAVNSPTNRLNDMTVNIPTFSLRVGSNPLEGYFNLKTPETDPTVDTKVKGVLNLGELTQAFPVEGVQQMRGIVQADVMLKAAMSQLERQLYDQVNVAGAVTLSDFVYKTADMPLTAINRLQTTFAPDRIAIQEFDVKLGRSDLHGAGQINNFLAYFSPKKTMVGSLTAHSNLFDANEWLTEQPTATTAGAPAATPSDPNAAAAAAPFDRWDFTVNGNVGTLLYDTYTLKNVAMDGHFKPNKMDIGHFAMNIGESDLSGSGTVLNAWNYLFDNQQLGGRVSLQSNFFDLNQFMTEDAPSQAAQTPNNAGQPVSSIIPVPENIDMVIQADMNRIRYTNYELKGLKGNIVVDDQRAVLDDCSAQLFGGNIALKGAYDTKDLSKPVFNFDLALQNMGFKETYESMVTMKNLAPIARFMDGKFNTTLSMSGLLGKDMMPDFRTLNAAGFLETINAMLSDFKGFSYIGERLNIPYLKNVDLSRSKNWFEVKDGRLVVKPFNVKVKDVNMQIAGEHGIGQPEMRYQILTKTPRALLNKNAVTANVNTGLNWLSAEASKVGVNLAQGEFINVRFDLTGALTSPNIAAKVLGTDGEQTLQETATATVTQAVEKAKDSLRNLADAKLNEAKDKAKAAADKAVDSLTRAANERLREVTDKAAQELKDKAGAAVGEKVGEQVSKQAEKVLGEQGKKTVDEVKGKLDKWDPFKKKPKTDNPPPPPPTEGGGGQ